MLVQYYWGVYLMDDLILGANEGRFAWQDEAFCACKKLKKIVLPDDLRSIGKSTFEFCDNLEEVSLGNGLQEIGDYAFFACYSLKEIVLPDTLRRLGNDAFCCCRGLREVIVPEGVLSIGRECFSNCTALRRVTLPASLREVGEGVFAKTGEQLEVQVHPDNPRFSAQGGNLLSKHGKTLRSCPTAKETVSIPDGITALGKGALSHCSISQVNLPRGLRRIGARAFYICSDLHAIDLPEGLRYIDAEAFRYSGISELTIPKSVRHVGRDVFGPHQVRHLTILGSHTSVERVCDPKDLQQDAMLTADGLEIEEYPEPFTAVHGLRSVATRWSAGQKVPDTVLERFRKYLAQHYREHWDEPAIFALAVAMKILPEEDLEEAITMAVEMKDPAVTAALLQYQHEHFYSEGKVAKRQNGT